eukprot:132194-Pleurochrysis_carterae.AAC.1
MHNLCALCLVAYGMQHTSTRTSAVGSSWSVTSTCTCYHSKASRMARPPICINLCGLCGSALRLSRE